MSDTRASILDLAHRQDGYFAELSQDIVDLQASGLISTVIVCPGFVIARAVPQPKPSHRAQQAMAGTVGAFPKAEAEVRP
jgi:hypothetical protein